MTYAYDMRKMYECKEFLSHNLDSRNLIYTSYIGDVGITSLLQYVVCDTRSTTTATIEIDWSIFWDFIKSSCLDIREWNKYSSTYVTRLPFTWFTDIDIECLRL